MSFETFIYQACRAYQTGESPAQSHVRLGVFFQKSPKPAGRQRVKKNRLFACMSSKFFSFYKENQAYLNFYCWSILCDVTEKLF